MRSWIIVAVAGVLNPVARAGDEVPTTIAEAFTPPARFRDDLGSYRSPLVFDDGRPVPDAADWPARRREIRKTWDAILGPWPPPIEVPKFEDLGSEHLDSYTRRRVRLRVAPDRSTEGYLLIPDGKGPFPAVLIVFYEPETAIGQGKPQLDFARRLAPRGYVALAIGTDPNAAYYPDREHCRLQPLSFHAYVASNCRRALAALPEVDADRIGVLGHSYGGKWAMFAACLDDRFACGVWSDPGIVFDESRPNVNYWEPWYLGWQPGPQRPRGVVTPENPRTGAYRRLVAEGRDLHELHALMAPRPFLVSGGSEDPPERWRALNHTVAVNRLLGRSNRVALTNRDGHTPTDESNAQLERFLDYALGPGARPTPRPAGGR